ncbi:hypothetical protein GCM10027046_09340 [Uliginosibacterium flavum]
MLICINQTEAKLSAQEGVFILAGALEAVTVIAERLRQMGRLPAAAVSSGTLVGPKRYIPWVASCSRALNAQGEHRAVAVGCLAAESDTGKSEKVMCH